MSVWRCQAQTAKDIATIYKIDYIAQYYYTLNLEGSHYWFKSYGDFAGLVDFAQWWSCMGKGLLPMDLPHLVFILEVYIAKQIKQMVKKFIAVKKDDVA